MITPPGFLSATERQVLSPFSCPGLSGRNMLCYAIRSDEIENCAI
jgi:hypothetical protein